MLPWLDMDRTSMEALATTSASRIRRAWVAMVAHLREENSVASIEERIRQGHGEPVSGARDAGQRLAAGVHGAYIAAGQVTARWLDKQFSKRFTIEKKLPVFDANDPPAVAWAQQNQLDLIREIDDETRSMIHDVLLDGARTGINPTVMAREIRESIGLTAYQTGIVDNYRRNLEEGQYASALRRQLSSGHSDKTIAAAMRDGRELSQAQIDKAVDRYRSNMVARRAETIGRTEGLRVAHQGSDETYRQAIARGDLRAEQLEQTWVCVHDSKTRSSHRAMDGQTRAFGEPFETGAGIELRYPCDPDAPAEETCNCRCVKTTRVNRGAGASAGEGEQGGPSLGGGTDEDVVVDDEAMAAEEAEAEEAEEAAQEEELAAEYGDEEAVDEEGEPADGADDGSVDVDVADLEDGSVDVDVSDLVDPGDQGLGQEPTPRERRDQALQQAQQRAHYQRSVVDQAKADLTDATSTHAQLQADLDELIASTPPDELPAGFRIGVSSEIAGETELDEASWLAEHRAQLERAATIAEPVAPPEILDHPYRTAPGTPRDTVLPSDKPAPVGFQAVTYNDETYYQQVITGRSYTAGQIAERQKPAYSFALGGPNEQIPGFEMREVKTASMSSPETRYISERSGFSWRPEDLASGEAQASEAWLAEQEAKGPAKSSVFRRLWNKTIGS